MKKLILLTIILLFSVAVTTTADENEPERNCTVVIGMALDCVVFHMDEFYHDHYSPYKSVLDSLPCDTKLKFVKTCSDLITEMGRGGMDLAVGRIDCYLRARRDVGVTPVVQAELDGSIQHRGVLLVRKDSDYKKIEDLEGAKFATINSESLMFNFFPKYIVKKRTGTGLRNYFGKVIKCPSIMAAIQSVILNQADVVSTDEEFLKLEEVREKLRPIESSFSIPNPLVFMRGDASPEVLQYVNKLKSELGALADEDKIGKIFNIVSGISEIEDPEFTEFTTFLKENELYDRVMLTDD